MTLPLPFPALAPRPPVAARGPAPTPGAVFAALGPKQQRVLAVLRDLCGDPTRTRSPQSDLLAGALGVSMSTLYRHRKGLGEMASFPANGYCSISRLGAAAVDAPPVALPSRAAPEACPRCGSQRSANIHAGATLYACGRIARWAGFEWIATGHAGRCPKPHLEVCFADGSPVQAGVEVRLCNLAERGGDGADKPSRAKPGLGRVAAVAADMVIVDPSPAPGHPRPYPAHALIPVGAADPSALSPHQVAVAAGLRNGTVLIATGPDGRMRLAPAAGVDDAVLSGHPGTLPALLHSGVVDDILATGVSAPPRTSITLAAEDDPLPRMVAAALDGLIDSPGARSGPPRMVAAYAAGGAPLYASHLPPEAAEVFRRAVLESLGPLARRQGSQQVIVVVDAHHASVWSEDGSRLLACRHRSAPEPVDNETMGLQRIALALPAGRDDMYFADMLDADSAHARMANANLFGTWNRIAGSDAWLPDIIRELEGDDIAVRVVRSGPGALMIAGEYASIEIAERIDPRRWHPTVLFAAATGDALPAACGYRLPPAQAEAWRKLEDGALSANPRHGDAVGSARVRAGVIAALAAKGLIRQIRPGGEIWVRVGSP